MKKREKYVRYGVCAVLILAACVASVVFLYLRRKKRKTPKKEALKGEAAERYITGEDTGKKAAAEGKTTGKNISRKEKTEDRTTEKERTEIPVEDLPSKDRADDSRQTGRVKKGMKRAAGVLYFVLILGICLVPSAFFWSRPAGKTAENRAMAPRPELQTTEGFNWKYLSDAGDYFTDHFAFRQELVAINARIRADLFGVSPVEDVIVGKNGWLYYAATLDDYQHKDSVSERMLFNMAHNTALMQEYCEGLGKTFLFTIAPNKNTLYDENMPDRLRYRVAEKSDAERFKILLASENVNYVNLFELFEEQEEVLYYARDSHWNEEGAVIVYNALLDACGKLHETYGAAEPVEKTDCIGDLGLMLFPVGGKPERRLQYPAADTWNYAEGESVEDPFIRTVNEAGEGNLLMYRDSFGNSLLPYMAQAFSQAAFSRQVPYPMTDLVIYEPDIVIVEKVERHLPTLGTVPPLMSGPERSFEKTCVPVKSAAATLQLSKEGSYWKFEGTTDAACMDVDSRIYVEVDDGDGAKLYEAFCVGRSDAENGSTNDYGYVLYLSEVAVTGNTFYVRVMTEQEEAMAVLLEKEIQG